MKMTKISLLISLILLSSIFLTGCWNYRELDKMAIVAGVAVDKGKTKKFKVTVSIVKLTAPDQPNKSQILSFEGNTVFDAVRNGIAITGKRLYWSHTKVIIISKDIAKEGIVSVMDWYNRDSETRFDVDILLSKEKTAAKIFTGKTTIDPIKSFDLDDMITNQKSLSKAPLTDMVKFHNYLSSEGISPVIPTVILQKADGVKVPSLIGTAIFKGDKLKGYLNGEESKSLLFIKDEIKGGVLPVVAKYMGKKNSTTLEIFKSKTKVTPIVKSNKIKIKINIKTDVAIDEIDGTGNFIDDKGRKKLEQVAAEKVKSDVESLIKKIQKEYDSDIFGFGSKVNQNYPKTWKRIHNDWDQQFKKLEVDVKADVHIENSATLSKTMKVKD